MSEKYKLLSQSAVYGVSSIVGRFLNYLLVPLYSRYFLPDQYGIVTELYSYAFFFSIILTYGLETGYFRFSNKENYSENTVFSTCLVSLLVTGILFFILVAFFAPALGSILYYYDNYYLLVLLAAILAIDSFIAIVFARLRKFNKAWKFAGIKLFNIGINIALNILFIVILPNLNVESLPWLQYDLGVGYILLANLIASIATLLLLVPDLLKVKYSFDFKLYKSILIYSFPLLFAGLAGAINEVADRIFLKFLIEPASDSFYYLGIYGANAKLAILMTLFIQAFRYAAEPYFFSQKNQELVKVQNAIATKYFAIFCLAIFLMIMLFINFFKYFNGVKYHEGVIIVPVLLMSNMLLGIVFNLSFWYKIQDKTKYGAFVALVGAIVTILANIILIPYLGYIGAAYAALLSHLAMVVYSFYLNQKYYPIKYDLFSFFIYLIISLLLYFLSTLTLFTNHIFNYILNGLYFLLFLTVVEVREKVFRDFFSYLIKKP